jgi:hypothetical protein
MTIYTCKKCNKEFKQKSGYDCHISRKYPCIKDIEIKFNCENCNKVYSTKYNLKIHMNTCSKKEKLHEDNSKNELEQLKMMLLEQQQKFEEQQKKIDELTHLSDHKEMKNNNITVTENSNNTNTNITNNTINIYSSGKEDLSILDKEDIIKLCTAGTFYPIIAAEILHCNEKYPEFQNVLISNLRASTGLVKINDKWITKSHDELLTNMMKVQSQRDCKLKEFKETHININKRS